MKYAQKLRLPVWQRKRLEILSERNFTCERCNSSERELHVHHKKYSRGKEPWDYPSNNFEVLCVDCHSDEHASRIRKPASRVNTPTVGGRGAWIEFDVISQIIKASGSDLTDEIYSMFSIGSSTHSIHSGGGFIGHPFAIFTAQRFNMNYLAIITHHDGRFFLIHYHSDKQDGGLAMAISVNQFEWIKTLQFAIKMEAILTATTVNFREIQ
jgi:hypothetical protein